MIPLNESTLTNLPDSIAVTLPTYPRSITHRICHIGVGGFHRAHQAVYLHRLLMAGAAQGWGICGIGLRQDDQPLFDALDAQDGLYSVWQQSATAQSVEVIGSIMEWVYAADDPSLAIAKMADPATAMVSLTITEKGYCVNPATNRLDLENPLIKQDLQHPEQPTSAVGVIVEALRLRHIQGLAPFTVVSCDNLRENGHLTQSVIVDYANAMSPSLAQWIQGHVRCPNSMVDRITPIPNPQLQHTLCTQWGVNDQALLVCEDWIQWVLEDQFSGPRPPFEQADVILSNDVPAFEAMKIGLLNGAHSALAYLGLLKGYTTIHEALNDTDIEAAITQYMEEAIPTLKPIDGMDFRQYSQAVIARFKNPAIEDTLTRVAEDSSKKMIEFIRPMALKQQSIGTSFRANAYAVACWIMYLTSKRDHAQAHYKDPSRDTLLAATGSDCFSLTAFLNEFFSLNEMPEPSQKAFADAVSDALERIRSDVLKP